jgi:hypothetical protein
MSRVGVAHRKLSAQLGREGRQWPALCAAVIVARAQLGLDPAAMARRLRVPVRTVEQLEAGGCAPVIAPLTLAGLAPELDWVGAGLPIRPPPSHPAACRHPSAHRQWEEPIARNR